MTRAPRIRLLARRLTALGWGMALLTWGCMPAADPAVTPPPPGDASREPPAAGSLRQDEITVEVVARGVVVRLTPLDSAILRLTAPDTRRRLGSVGAPGSGAAFLVSVFTEEPGGADFEPRDVALENRGRIYRPATIRGLTPGWGVRLEQRRAEQAVYTFPEEVDLELPVVVEVAGTRSHAWAEILTRIDVERARMRARGPQVSRPNLRILR
ncbi:MAG TPA: hypothetical protein VLA43_19295 [Longimicrobiales bacterium]|nr:hypothetical protein [Longimicrobiales bacterium]